MRYIRVLLWVLLFFFIMLFFVQNQDAFAQEIMLRLDTIFFTFESSSPVHFYTLLLSAFLLGGVVCFIMLVWDRLGSSAREGMAYMKIRGLARDTEKALKARTVAEEALEVTKEKLSDVEKQLAESKTKNAELEKTLANIPHTVSF